MFSPAGQLVTSFGRAGDGPEEFRGIEWVDTCGGQGIVVYDFARFRVTKWDVNGSLQEEFGVEGPRGDLPPYSVSCGPKGTFAVVGWPDRTQMPEAEGGYRPNVTIGVAGARGQFEHSLGIFPGTERYRGVSNDRPHPFGKTTTARMGVDRVYVGTADSFAIEILTLDGSRSSMRHEVSRSFGRAEREAWVESYVSRAPAESRARLQRSILDAGLVPDAFPAYAGFRLDTDGFIWVAPFSPAPMGSEAPVDWVVFDAAGDWVSSISLPGNFQPSEIGRDYVLGVTTDELGVQRVRRYDLIRIDDLRVSRGHLPPRALGLVVEWATLHRSELEEVWRQAQAMETLSKIPPLE